jgi:hypothetical protein
LATTLALTVRTLMPVKTAKVKALLTSGLFHSLLAA